MNQALDALQPVLEALYHPEGIGHAALRECVGAALAAAHNPHGFEDLSVGALYLFQVGGPSCLSYCLLLFSAVH